MSTASKMLFFGGKSTKFLEKVRIFGAYYDSLVETWHSSQFGLVRADLENKIMFYIIFIVNYSNCSELPHLTVILMSGVNLVKIFELGLY